MEISIAQYLRLNFLANCHNKNFQECIHNFVSGQFACTCKHGYESALFIFEDGSKLFADKAFKNNYLKLEVVF